MPVKGKDRQRVIDFTMRGEWDLRSSCWTELSRDLFRKLVKKNPGERYDADLALEHPWITRKVGERPPMTVDEIQNLFFFKAEFKMFMQMIQLFSFVKSECGLPEDDGTVEDPSPKTGQKFISNYQFENLSKKSGKGSNSNSYQFKQSPTKISRGLDRSDGFIQKTEKSLNPRSKFGAIPVQPRSGTGCKSLKPGWDPEAGRGDLTQANHNSMKDICSVTKKNLES